jgi:rubrerythrin
VEAPAVDEPKKKFVCRICGYIHEAERLPDDFTCPLCGRPASDFEEVK